ncbi:hypothetical protein BJY04DRAFT_81885 [Aspergillus karnatakaensis]|uniref:GNAT family N-acetyltransferase n=1 Tax=Aspergillus karnatakaensis TaxID=1810916 RepID=UPI003CCD1A13
MTVKNTLKMSESSDEIVLSRAKRRDTSCNPRPVGTFRKPTGVGLLSDDDLSSEGEAANNQKENYRETVMDNVKEELERLRKPIVVNAHRRVSDWPTASPELLKRYRTGPGTDQCSKEYLEIAQIRAVLQAEIPDLSYLPGSSQVFEETSHDADPDALKRQLQSHLKVRQEVYKKTETAFPTLIDGTITLSPTPTKKHRKALAQSRYPKAPEGTLNPKSLLAGKDEVLILHSSWDDPVILDWAYCPRCITDEKAYHVDFQRWLDVTISHECTVDIYHQTFFDGTSHADGESSMFMLDMCSFETQLDPRDEASRLHAHETAAGYILNLLMQTQEAEVAEEHRRLMSRKANLEYQQKRALNMRTPASPVANIYLRPVDDRDASELKDILDEFAHDSFETPDTMSINRSEVRGRIESSRTARLPFIVAVDRRTASTTPEKILGYALAKDFESPHRGSQYTAELEVYVRKEHTNLGIGRCLLDKLLEVCDPSYISKSGYQFEASYGERSAYYPGGSRKLARLLFKLGYVDQEISKHNRVKRWLKDHAGFEEQGVLRGVRLKKKFLVNVTYLVRNVGHSKSNKWEP